MVSLLLDRETLKIIFDSISSRVVTEKKSTKGRNVVGAFSPSKGLFTFYRSLAIPSDKFSPAYVPFFLLDRVLRK